HADARAERSHEFDGRRTRRRGRDQEDHRADAKASHSVATARTATHTGTHRARRRANRAGVDVAAIGDRAVYRSRIVAAHAHAERTMGRPRRLPDSRGHSLRGASGLAAQASLDDEVDDYRAVAREIWPGSHLRDGGVERSGRERWSREWKSVPAWRRRPDAVAEILARRAAHRC